MTALAAVASLAACSVNPLQSEAGAIQSPSHIELGDVPFFPQDEYQCGPAALATVLTASGATVSPQQLTEEVYLPGKKGSLQAELIAAARARDRVAYPIDATLASLLAQVAAGHPVLVLQNLGLKRLPAWHYAVVIGYDSGAGQLILRSGTNRRLVADARRFMRTWDRAQRWGVVVLEPGQLPAQPDLTRYIAAVASLEATGRLDAAHRAYQRARAYWPDSAWPALGMANVSQARGDDPTAERSYFETLELDPTNVVARNNLAELLIKRGCAAAARAHIARARTFAQGTPLEAPVNATAKRIFAMGEQDSGVHCPPL